MDYDKLHVVFLPYFIPSHTVTLVDIARLFAARGVEVTILSTPYNTALFQSSIDHEISLGYRISVHTLTFPAVKVGLPYGIENFGATTSILMVSKLYQAISLLQEPMENYILQIKPHCIFSDMFYPWTTELAEKLQIPRILFYPTNFFTNCLQHNLDRYAAQKKVKSDREHFLMEGLPDRIEMKRSQLENYEGPGAGFFAELMKQVRESEDRSHGIVFDSVYELEPEYVDMYKKSRGNSLSIGPVFHFAGRGEVKDADPKHECLDWLDSQEHNKVLFICFGSMVKFPDAQLTEIALALGATNHPFIWVVKSRKTDENGQENWLPHGFEEKMKKTKKGLIFRGWAPQLKIMNHPAVGGFLTHCGWNSILEGLTAGLPMITWPLFAEQFYNEKLVEVIGVGVRVGAEHWNFGPIIQSPLVDHKQIEEAIKRLMDESGESKKMREKAKEAAAKAKNAVIEEGSSYNNLVSLIEEIKSCAEKVLVPLAH